MKKLEVVDFLKGYSILTIVIFHCFQNLNLTGLVEKGIQFGGTGVHLFIFLSGFGLYTSYLNKSIDFIAFIKKRFSKIYIPYILIVIISYIISLFIPIYPNSNYALSGHVFLFKMFDEDIMSSYGYQLWYISTIIQFYLSFYAIVWIKDKIKHNNIFLLICFLTSVTWGITIILSNNSEIRIWNSFFLQYLWEFALGMCLAEKIRNSSFAFNIKLQYYLLIGIIAVIIFGTLSLKGGDAGKVFNDVPALISYSFIALFIYKLNCRPVINFMLFTGKISYSLYLVHILVLFLIKYYCTTNNIHFSYPAILISITISYVVATYYNKLVFSTPVVKLSQS
jgi:peptidoglycan/LPS O-acetylase OafA/YrhL